MRIKVVILMFLTVAATASATIILPHTFRDESPALAHEVNANFAALAGAVEALIPVGAVLPFAGAAAAIPEGWLLCNGQQLDPTNYPDLYTAIGEAHGGDGGDSFRVPDYRGRFLRGVDAGAAAEPG